MTAPDAGPADLKLWRGLVDAAFWTAARPVEVDRLAKAWKRARNSTMPRGQCVPGSTFAQLIKLATRWDSLRLPERVDAAPELQALASAADQVLTPFEAEAGGSLGLGGPVPGQVREPPRPPVEGEPGFRRDVDG